MTIIYEILKCYSKVRGSESCLVMMILASKRGGEGALAPPNSEVGFPYNMRLWTLPPPR